MSIPSQQKIFSNSKVSNKDMGYDIGQGPRGTKFKYADLIIWDHKAFSWYMHGDVTKLDLSLFHFLIEAHINECTKVQNPRCRHIDSYHPVLYEY